jgi:WD40 repeat protein
MQERHLRTDRGPIFVSYSHADKAWLERLCIILKPYPVYEHLWMDPYIQVGDRWEREIDGALQAALVGLLLVSTDFFASDFIVRKELPALLQASEMRGLRIFCVPVGTTGKTPRKRAGLDGFHWSRSPDSPLAPLTDPHWKAALVETAEALQRLFDERSAADPPLGAAPHNHARPTSPVTAQNLVGAEMQDAQAQPAAAIETVHSSPPVAHFEGVSARLAPDALLKPVEQNAKKRGVQGAPALPPHFVAREQDLFDLKRALLELRQPYVGISGAARGHKAGLHGQGGIGKTVLATALVHDADVQATFCDGIYWLTLGQEPNNLALQQQLAAMLDLSDEASRRGILAETLRTVLRDKCCLVVLDDVWRLSDAQALDLLGSAGRMLITTRDELLLASLRAHTRRIDALERGAARSLLAQWAKLDVSTLPSTADDVAERCGYLPLALALAGAQVNAGSSWPDVLQALRDGDLEFLDHPHGSVFKSLSASVRALQQSEAARYLELAIFPEDIAIPEDVIVRLWSAAGVSAPRARKLLRSFAARSLLTVTSDETSVVTFHDLQRDYLRLIVQDLRSIHGQLLDVYARTLPQSEPAPYRWSGLAPCEQYVWRYFCYHMQEAERVSQLHALARDLRWLQAKIAASWVDGLLEHLRMLHRASPTPELQKLERAVRLECGWLYQDPSALPSLLYNRLRAEGVSGHEITEELLHNVPRLSARLRFPVELGGEERITLRGHVASVRSCAISADGNTVVSASWDDTLRVWDAQTGAERVTLYGHFAAVNGCTLSADAKTVVSASDDKTLKVWDVETGDSVTLRGHTAAVNDCAISADGTTVLSASDDTTLKVWGARTGRDWSTLRGHSASVRGCALNADGSAAVSASWDGTLKVWDVKTGDERVTLRGHSAAVWACVLSVDGSSVVSASWDGRLKVWDAQTGAERVTLRGHSDTVRGCALSADGNTIVSASDDKTLRVWELNTGNSLMLRRHSAAVLCCAVSADGDTVVSASDDNTLKVWNAQTGVERATLRGHSGTVRGCALSADGNTVVSASDDKTLKVWDAQTGDERRTLQGYFGAVWACSVSADGNTVVSASGDNSLKVCDTRTGAERATLHGHSAPVRGCAMSADGRTVVSVSWDDTLRVWDAQTGRTRFTRPGTASGKSCAVSADGTTVVSVYWDNKTLVVWNVQAGRNRVMLRGHSATINDCAVSADGTTVFSASDDNSLKVWDAEKGGCLATVYGAAAFISVATAPGIIVAGDVRGNVWMLDWCLENVSTDEEP